MKKISLKDLGDLGIEKLSRDVLKSIVGGNSPLDGDDDPFATCTANCECPTGWILKDSATPFKLTCSGTSASCQDNYGATCVAEPPVNPKFCADPANYGFYCMNA